MAPRAPKKCGHPDCQTRVTGRVYCTEHDRTHRWGRQSNRVVPGDWKHRKTAALTRDHATCHACGHPGAEQVDHLLNVAAGGTHQPTNLAPIHGKPCPTCQRRCHTDKTQAEAAAGRGQAPRT